MDDVFLTVVQFIPLILVLWLANMAERRRGGTTMQGGAGEGRGWAATVYVLLSLTFFLMFIAGVLLSLGGWLLQISPEALPLPGAEDASSGTRMVLLGLSLLAPALLGPILLIPGVRRGLARFLPLDPRNRVHTVALAATMLVWAYFFFFLSIGLENLAKLSEAQGESNPMPSLWAQQITFFLAALIGVGWLSRRSLQEALHRLGLVKPTPGQWGIGVGAGLGLVAGALLLENLARLAGISADPNVEKLTEQLMGPLYGSVWGILTLGLSAALGEEAIFRGALQPRLGLVLTSLLFAIVHSNYGLSLSTVIVFLVGLSLGWLRMRHNTSTTMIVHATYNMTLGLLATLAV